MVFYDKDKTEKFEDVKFSKITNNTPLFSGTYPDKPNKGEITQIAVSKGYIKEVLKMDPSSISYTTNDSKVTFGGYAYNFYMCGVSHIPTQTEFNITGIIDTDDVVVYAPSPSTGSTLYNSWINFINCSYSSGNILCKKRHVLIQTCSNKFLTYS